MPLAPAAWIIITNQQRQNLDTDKRQLTPAASPAVSGYPQLGPHDRHTASRSKAQDLAPILAGLPEDLHSYLDTFDEGEADAILESAADSIDGSQIRVLAQLFDIDPQSEQADRILNLLSRLQTESAIEEARAIVQNEERQIDDPILLACAMSIAEHPDKQGLAAILSRLNNPPPELDRADILGMIFSRISDPAMEYFIGQAAEGTWGAVSPTARHAAINALANYPTHRTTAILSHMATVDPDPSLRKRSYKVLSQIRSQPAD